MEKDNILILEDGLKCELLNRVTLANNNYFLAEQLDETDEGMGKYAILKEIKENNEYYVVKEERAEVLLEVLKLLTKEFADNVDSLKVEDLI